MDHFSSFDLLVIDEYGLHLTGMKNAWRWCVRLYIHGSDDMKFTLLNFQFHSPKYAAGFQVSKLWSRLHENHPDMYCHAYWA